MKKGEEDKHKQPEIDMENGMKILEEYMWESKQLIRDLCLDWWKERKEKAFQIRKLEHLLNKKHDLVNRTMLHSKEQGMGIVSFAKTLGLETKSSKINDAIKEIEQILNNDCNNILNPEENVIGFNKVRNLSQKIFKHSEKGSDLYRDSRKDRGTYMGTTRWKLTMLMIMAGKITPQGQGSSKSRCTNM